MLSQLPVSGGEPLIMLRLFRRQEGTALVMAMGILVVLTIAGTTLMVYSTQNTRSAARSKSDETSFSLSEAALNNAMAVLSNPSNNALDPDVLPNSLATASSVAYENGTAKWYGVLDRANAWWTVTALGIYNSPTSGSTQVTRKLTATFDTGVPPLSTEVVSCTLTEPLEGSVYVDLSVLVVAVNVAGGGGGGASAIASVPAADPSVDGAEVLAALTVIG